MLSNNMKSQSQAISASGPGRIVLAQFLLL